MSDWFYHLPVLGMGALVLAVTAVINWLIFSAVARLAAGGQRAHAFKSITPGLLPPLGIVFGLLVAFLSAQVWSDAQRAALEVSREASALRGVDLLAASFPNDVRTQTHTLLRRYVTHVVQEEWPAMARNEVTLAVPPEPLTEALRLSLAIEPVTDGQRVAQREIVASLQEVLDARRQRIIISRSSIDWVKWVGLIGVAILVLIGIAMVHCDNKTAAATAMGLFAAAVALSVMLIAAHARPFTGQISVGPGLLEEVVR